MDLGEWLLFFAIIDGPIIALLYMIIRRLQHEIK